MDKLIEKIIEQTALKNWTLFLFIFAICYAVGLRLIAKAWFHLPDEKFNQTTLFLLEVFLSSLTITRILVAIKFLEAINRTPIIADFINWIVVDRREVVANYKGFVKKEMITGICKVVGGHTVWRMEYNYGIIEKEVWGLIHNNIIVDDGFPYYKICQKAVAGKGIGECSDEKFGCGYCVFTLTPALYRGLDRKCTGGFWIPQRPLCLEHFILIAFLAGAIDLIIYICLCIF